MRVDASKTVVCLETISPMPQPAPRPNIAKAIKGPIKGTVKDC